MQQLDVRVLEKALTWLQAGKTIWFSTVLTTYGSSPRAPGSLLVADNMGNYEGSLSGGCVEEDFLAAIQQGRFSLPVQTVRYGDAEYASNSGSTPISLPCGGILVVLVECVTPSQASITHFSQFLSILTGNTPNLRLVEQLSGLAQFCALEGPCDVINQTDERVEIRVGPASRLIIAGISPVTEFCAHYAATLGFEVIVCDPREDVCAEFDVEGVTVKCVFPADYIIEPGHVHSQTAVVALTHDPRIDDLAIVDAVSTNAFYFGVMGSKRTSANRAVRLKRSGGLTDEQIAKIKMPIGLNLGSKTPAEIALAVMADILRCSRGIERDQL